MNKLKEQMLKERLPVHPKCQGIGFSKEELKFVTEDYCNRIEPIEIADKKTVLNKNCRCVAYINPASWWRRGRCPLASHFRPDLKEVASKKRVGQQKQRKK